MAAFLEEDVDRKLEETCFDLSKFETPYNNDARAQTYRGIMFDLVPKSDVEILTLEVDVSAYEANEDLTVKVYSTLGGFRAKINDPNQWTLIADTVALRSPDGSGIIIPQRAFENIQLKARQRISLYIYMEGKYIENTAQALVKTGELAYQGSQFDSYAGVGTNSPFPESPETTTDPQFAGKVYFQKPISCEDSTKTEVDLVFLTGDDYDHSSINPISQSVETVAKDFLMDETWFSTKASTSDLAILENTKTTTAPYNGGTCPWESAYCSTFKTTLSFTHSSDLSPGELRFNVYRYVDAIMRDVRGSMPSNQIAYLGLKSTKAGFSFTVSGVPQGDTMNSEQEDYFARSLVNFFHTAVTTATPYVDVFDSKLKGDDDIFRNLRVHRKLDGTIAVDGTMYGGRAAPLDKEEFDVQLQSTLSEKSDVLVNTLKYGSVVPQSDLPSEEDLQYFDSVTAVTGEFMEQGATDTDWGDKPFDHSQSDNVVIVIDPDNNGGGGGFGGFGGNREDPKLDGDKISNLGDEAGGSPVFILIAAIVGGLLVVAAGAYFAYERYKKKKYQQELERYRQKAKAERKIKRLSKDDSCEKLRKDALKALGNLDEEKGGRTASTSDSDGSPPECARTKSSLDLDQKLKEMKEKRDRKEKKEKRGRSKRDTSSLPDLESIRRRERSSSHDRSPTKRTMLASFMEEESKKRKPGDRHSGTRSLDGDDIRRKPPARAFSDRSHSQNSGDGPDRKKTSRSRSSDELEDIREALNRRNADSRVASPRSDRGVLESTNLQRSRSDDLKAMSNSGHIETRSAHTRSINLPRSNSSDFGSRSAHNRSINLPRSNSADFGSRSAHTRTIRLDTGSGLYGSGPPRRGTRPQGVPASPGGRSRSNSPSRRAPGRSQSCDQRLRGTLAQESSVHSTRSGDLSAMRQAPNRPEPSRGNLRASYSADLGNMRQHASGNEWASKSAHIRSDAPSPNPDQLRRGRKREGAVPDQEGGSSRPRGVPQSPRGIPQRSNSYD